MNVWAKSGCVTMVMLLLGCDAPMAKFGTNAAFQAIQEQAVDEAFTTQQVQDVVDALAALVGTPDKPYVVAGVGAEDLIEPRNLKLAAGPVGHDEQGNSQGLYRRHCAHCHGISGDGAGPTAAFLNPYPRDYRMGKFKFKSTPIGVRPTHDDLRRILINGIPGTAMPSFKLLPDGQINALVDYVKYLSIRGEVERFLLAETSDLDAEEERLDTSAANLVEDKLAGVLEQWRNAGDRVTEVPERLEMDDLQARLHRGRELYYGSAANCVKCHGDTQLGDGQVTDYDDWTKEYHDWAGGTPELRKEKLTEYLALGGFEPRNIRPRNLRKNVYRGGRRPIDLFRRVKNGIEGTPMPAAAPSLTSDDIWCLIDYVRSLPYESLSQPRHAQTYVRDRL